jgi:phage-related minor tail protein
MDEINDVETWTVRVDADLAPLQRELTAATQYGRQFSAALGSAFEGLAFKGKSFGDVLNGLALSLSKMALQSAFKPLEQGLGQLFSGLIGGVGTGATAFANGGVVAGGVPVPFAAGGVIRSPITFPLAGGQMGIAGERGAEAIMPLARGPDGRLGVAAGGMSGGRSIVFNVTTPDADSFRRSETQIAALVARAAALGQRNL